VVAGEHRADGGPREHEREHAVAGRLEAAAADERFDPLSHAADGIAVPADSHPPRGGSEVPPAEGDEFAAAAEDAPGVAA
jgi:hypothetical protein